MTGIPVYQKDAEDFSSNGLGLVFPTSCTVQEKLNGRFSISMTVPLTEDGRWKSLVPGAIVKARCPVRVSPEASVPVEEEGSVTQRIFEVRVRTRLNFRSAPNGRVLASYPSGTEVIELEPASGGWMHVALVEGGQAGYMYASYLRFSREVTLKGENMQTAAIPANRDQLFRLYRVEADTREGELRAEGLHIFYDLTGNLIASEVTADALPASAAAEAAFRALLAPTPFCLYASALTKRVSGDYGWKNPVEALLNDNGILANAHGWALRDNYDIYLMPLKEDAPVRTLRLGMEVNRVSSVLDDLDAVTRIVPCGRTAKGEELYLSSPIYVESPRAGLYPAPRVKKINYNYTVKMDASTADGVRALLRAAAEADFAGGIDLPEHGVEVEVLPGADNLLRIADRVRVTAEALDLDAALTVTGYTWDVVLERFLSVELGSWDVDSLKWWGGSGTSSGASALVTRPAAAMTGSASMGCAATASSVYSSKFPAWRAFDGDTDTAWASASSDERPWICLQMDEALSDISISVYSRTSSYVHNPVSGTISASNDGETWAEIGAFSLWSPSARGALLGHIDCENQEAYSYVRIDISSHSGAGYTAIGNIVITGKLPEE